ncbi:MAG: methylenetetrahydrofolate reductase [NAD(P)H] [bacterium]
MSIRSLLQSSSSPTLSFELFPPKTAEAEKSLYENLERLAALSPSFISVTMGAMGTNKGNTMEIVHRIQKDYGINGVAHLTCVNATRDNMLSIFEELKRYGIHNLLCLRGDPPQGTASFQAPENGFRYANELVSFVREKTGNAFSIGVAGYPEGHPECGDKEADLQHLKLKIDAGGEYVLTQLFFDNEDYFRFVERARKSGIDVPIIPGIMPITNFNQLKKFTQMCGAKIPAKMAQDLEKIKDDLPAVRRYGVEYAVSQCEGLLKKKAPGLHFYPLNQSDSVQKILQSLKQKGFFL